MNDKQEKIAAPATTQPQPEQQNRPATPQELAEQVSHVFYTQGFSSGRLMLTDMLSGFMGSVNEVMVQKDEEIKKLRKLARFAPEGVLEGDTDGSK